MYEQTGQSEDFYVKLDTIFVIQCTFSFSIASILQLLIVYIIFKMISNEYHLEKSPSNLLSSMTKTTEVPA